MARHLDPGALTGELVRKDLVFSVAQKQDEPDLRRLLAENRLGGRYQVTFEREPDAYRADFGLADFQVFIIARSSLTGEPVGLCEKVVWPALVNGTPQQLPYIGALRVSEKYRNRVTVLKGGFEALRRFGLHGGELPYALTSITSDNLLARRILTAGLPGLPAYHPAGDFSTFVMRTGSGPMDAAVSPAAAADLPEIAAFLNRTNAAFQFAFAWTAGALLELGALGLKPEHFLTYRKAGILLGCIAVWDQRTIRQTVIRGYPPFVRRLRPLANLASPLTGLPHLPRIGETINQALLSHLAVAGEDPAVFAALVTAALSQARQRGLNAAAIGLASARPLAQRLTGLRRVIEYRTSLYLAHWPEGADAASRLDDRLPHPEMALL